MPKNSVTMSYKQIGAIILILLDLIILGPGGWILKTLWEDAKTFRTETEDKLEDLQKQIEEVKVYVSSGYVTRKTFSDYREQVGENMRHLDSKIANTK